MAPVYPISATGQPPGGDAQVNIAEGAWGARQALAAAAAAGLPAERCEVVQVVSTALLRCGDLAVKVHPPADDPDRQRRMLRACAVWAEEGLCVAPAWDEPVATAEGLVTAWWWQEPAGELSWSALGRLLRRLHAASPAGILDVWRPLERLGDQLHAWQLACGARPDVAAELTALAQALQAEAAGVEATGVIHGDVSPANVVVTAGGPLLIDFDRACLGPAPLDLVAAARHAGAAGARDDLVAGYGADPAAWAHRGLVDAIHDLGALTFRLGLAGTQPVDEGWLAGQLDRLLGAGGAAALPAS